MAIAITGFQDDEPPLTGTFDSGATTDDSSPRVLGTITAPLDAGESVVVLRNDAVLGTANVTGTTWAYQDGGLANGTYIYSAQVVNLGGVPTQTSGAFTMTVAASPSQIVTIMAVQDNLPPVIGLITEGSTTNDDTPTLQGTLSAGLSSGQSVHIFRNGIDVGTARVSGTSWEYEDGGLQSGHTYTYTARVVDKQGNMGSESQPISFTLDTVQQGGIEIEHIVDNVLPVLGDIPNNGVTNDTSPRLNGSLVAHLVAGETIEILRDGVVVGTALLPSTDSTTWTFQDSGLESGKTYTYTARITGSPGGEVPESSAWKITVDTTVPTAKPTITNFVDNELPQTGEFFSGDSTNDIAPLLQGTITGALGLKEVVAIYRGDIKVGSVPVNSDGSWSFQDGGLHDGQTYTYRARVEDAAGNQGEASADFMIAVDTTPPAVTAPVKAIADDSGLSPTDFITNDKTLVISGTVTGPLAAGEKVQVTLDGGLSWITAVTTGTEWTLDNTANPLPEGKYTVQTRVIDAAGNLGKEESQIIVIDTTPPLPAKIAINAIAGNDVLDSNEAKGEVTITGTLTDVPSDAVSQGMVVTVGGVSHTPTISGSNWSVTVQGSELVSAAAAGGGIYGSVVAELKLADAAGNTTSTTEDRSYLLDVKQTPSHVYTVSTAYAGLGYAMSAISDFNGDGYADYVVSAPGSHYGNLLSPGKSVSYLLYGGPNGLPNVSDLDSITAAQGIRITSSNKSGAGLQGMTVADIGDFNGDGLSDVAISSNLNNATYVLYGQAGSAIRTLDLDKLTAAQGFSVKAACWAPASAMGADINGDGYSDLIVSNLDCGGKFYVIYGHAGAQGNITYSGSIVKGAAAGYTTASGTNGLGTVLSAVGDMNGDGFTDFIATMPGNASAGGKQPGSAYLVFGGPNGVSQPGTTQVNLDKMGPGKVISISASNAYEHLGGQAGCGGNTQNADAYKAEFHSVSDLGNIDGSGRSAFAIGSPGASPSNGKTTTAYTCGSVTEGAGAVYVLYSHANWSNLTLPSWDSVTNKWSGGSLDGSNGFVIYSSSFAKAANGKLSGASDLGFSVGSAGDVNGDGIGDFLIGAPAAYNGKGAAYLVFGTPGGLPGASSGAVDLDQLVAAGKLSAAGTAGTAIEYVGTQAMSSAGGGNLGTDVTGGDFSGTGLSGYAFGAWGQNVAKPQTGEVYTYDGISTFLTQLISNADNAVYYAGQKTAGAMPAHDGVDLIATGSGNNAWVHGIGTDTTGGASTGVQHDAVNGGRGDDHIGIIGTTFTGIDGGGGQNTLVFEASNLTLDLTQMGLRVQNITQFDLNNQSHSAAADPKNLFADATTGNTLKLTLADVVRESDGVASAKMSILGNSSSTVDLTDAGWAIASTQNTGGVNFDVYHNAAMGSNTVADLLIQQGVHVI